MKKNRVLLLIMVLSTTWLGAQEPGENIAQPQSFIGRKINASEEVIKEYEASFSYLPDGKLDSFLFPEWGTSSVFNYENNFLSSVITQHQGAWPFYSDVIRYTYEDGRVKTESHLWDAMNSNQYIEYEYYDDGRLYKKSYASYNPDDVYAYSIFEYENEGKTKIEYCYGRIIKENDFVWYPESRITYRYNDSYALISEQTDDFNANGEITISKRKNYTYTPSGKLETEISQILTENEWVNHTIQRCFYDAENFVTEQQDGTWSITLNDWNIATKTIHEYSADRMTYTVSFFKKSGDNWVRDIFNYQKLFFESELKWQQEALNYFAYDDMLGSAQINQFEFQMLSTKKPTYFSAKEASLAIYTVYPNPGKDCINISSLVENTIVRFYDLQGRLLLAKPFDFQTNINTGDWAPGIYLWEIWNGTQKEASGKWVKD